RGGERARAELVSSLDGDRSVAVAYALAEMGDRRALAPLVALLRARDERVRASAIEVLEAIARDAYGYRASASPDERAPATQRWRAWLEAKGTTVTWATPLPLVVHGRDRLLVALYSKRQVVELDMTGRVVWSAKDLNQPWAVCGRRDGSRVIALYGDRTIVEFDAAGRRTWSSKAVKGSISSVSETRAGNLLVAAGFSVNQIVELGAGGQVLWRLTIPGRPVCAYELPDGKFLVTLKDLGKVVEVSRRGTQSTVLEGLRGPYFARRTRNATLLVVEQSAGVVSEFNAKGERLWESPKFDRLYSAVRLRDGSTLIGDKEGVKRIAPDGSIRLIYKTDGGYVYIARY
ncbi:MAG: hypothetical protein AAGD14_11205, partial [Planctomycetota bacterium]